MIQKHNDREFLLTKFRDIIAKQGLQCRDMTEDLVDVAIAHTQEAPAWISVKDRLPDENVNVIGFINGEMFIVNHINGDWADGLEFTVVDYPTHWLPLPASPTEQKGED